MNRLAELTRNMMHYANMVQIYTTKVSTASDDSLTIARETMLRNRISSLVCVLDEIRHELDLRENARNR